MSQPSASSQPPPSAKPLIAATVGLGISSSSRAASWPSAPHSFASSGPRPPMYLMSAPATNARSPAPVRTTTRADSSSASSARRSRSSVSVSTLSAFSASCRSMVTTATASLRSTTTLISGPPASAQHFLGISCGDSAFQEIDDLGRRRAGPEDAGDAELAQALGVLVRNRAADDDHHVLGAVLAQELEDARHERHVRAGEDGDPHRVSVLLDRGLDDLLRRLVEARVDDLHACVAERAGDALCAAIVPIEARLRDDDADLPCHRAGGYLVRRRGSRARCPRPRAARRTSRPS